MRGTNWTSTFTLVAIGVLETGALLFLSAGTLAFWQGWLLLLVLAVSFAAALISPGRSDTQPDGVLPDIPCAVLLLGGVAFDAALVIAGLNDRFRWLVLPGWLPYGGAILLLAAVGLCAAAKRQPAIETAHGAVRLPFVLSVLLMLLAVPVVLGSAVSFGLMLLAILLLSRWTLPKESRDAYDRS